MTVLDVVVVGGGQAGLAMGYHLRERGVRFEILDASPTVGHVWRERWNSLRLFTPAQYASLPGRALPADRDTYPTKDQVADIEDVSRGSPTAPAPRSTRWCGRPGSARTTPGSPWTAPSTTTESCGTNEVSPVAGLYVLGLPWQHTTGSALLGFVGHDAAYLADHIARRIPASQCDPDAH